jgi:hypothetical protein
LSPVSKCVRDRVAALPFDFGNHRQNRQAKKAFRLIDVTQTAVEKIQTKYSARTQSESKEQAYPQHFPGR